LVCLIKSEVTYFVASRHKTCKFEVFNLGFRAKAVFFQFRHKWDINLAWFKRMIIVIKTFIYFYRFISSLFEVDIASFIYKLYCLAKIDGAL